MDRTRFVLLALGALAAAPFVYGAFFSVPASLFVVGSVLLLALAWLLARRFAREDLRVLLVLGAFLAWSVAYWTVLGLFTNVRRTVEMDATWRAAGSGRDRRLVFDYSGQPGCFESVRSAELERRLAGREGQRVRVTLVLTYDFGDLRCYHVEAVDGVTVRGLPEGEGWVGGQAPWTALKAIRP